MARSLESVELRFSRVGQLMWIEKLADGVLQVDTPIGPRFIQPNFLQRALLLWTFPTSCRFRSKC